MQEFNFNVGFKEKNLHNKFKFKCVKGCDSCCKMNDIALYPFDIMELCNLLGVATKEFHSKYTRFVYDSEAKVLRCYLITFPTCVFFDSTKACTVYDSRPVRCRMFPVARMFNRDGAIQHFLTKDECIGFKSGKKHTIEEWIKESGVNEKNELIKEWTSFINELKNNYGLPLQDQFFIVMFKKIFYDFDNELSKIVETQKETSSHDLKARMQQLYELAKIFLFHVDEWKKGYDNFVKESKL